MKPFRFLFLILFGNLISEFYFSQPLFLLFSCAISLSMENDDYITDKIFEQIEKDGVSSIAVKDGHVLVFQLAKLKEIIQAVENAGKITVCIFVQNGKSLN